MTKLNRSAVTGLPKCHTHAIVHECDNGQRLLVTSGSEFNMKLMMDKLHFMSGKTEIYEIKKLRKEYDK